MESLSESGPLLSKARALFVRLIGLFLLVLPFVPLPRLYSKLAGPKSVATPGEWLLGMAICVTIAWLLSLLLPERVHLAFKKGLNRVLETQSRRPEILALCVLGAALIAFSFLVVENRSRLVDSTVQLFQAQVFAMGELTVAAPKHIAFFITQHMLTDEHGWYSQYPPGHSALLALGVLIRAPWLICIALTVGAAFFTHRFVREIYDLRTARLSLLLMLISPFFFLMGTSFMNHCSALFFLTVFTYLFIRWYGSEETHGNGRLLLFAGAALGLCFLCRPLSAIAGAVPFGFMAVVKVCRTRRPLPLLWGAFGFALTAAWFFIYNHYTTGDAFLPGYVKLWGSSHGLGFHKSPWGAVHTPAAGLRNELADLWLLNRTLFDWPIPSLLPLGLFFLLRAARSKWDHIFLAAFLAFPTCYFFYWYRALYLGPRFLYESLIFVIPLTARAFDQGITRLTSVSFKIPLLFRPVPLDRLVMYLMLLCFGYSLFVSYPFRTLSRRTRNASLRLNVVDEAKAAGISEGLIFLASCWGERILANLREYGVGAPQAEEAYRTCDHCLLQEIIDRAGRGMLSPAEVQAEVQALIDQKMVLVNPNLNGDPTLKIRPNAKLSARCWEEIRHDENGKYIAYFPHLIENSPLLDSPVIVARDLRDRNGELIRLYPEKPPYLYRSGKFTRIEPRP